MSVNEKANDAVGYLATPSVRLSCRRILEWGGNSPMLANDAMKVAAAMLPYLDETPVDEKWLQSVGAVADMEACFEELFAATEGYQVGDPVPRLSTRGLVRALCAVLRVPVREEAHP